MNLKISEIVYHIKDKKILEGVTFEIKKGDIVFLLGENGSGKSSLIKLILGIQQATSGTIVFDDEVLNSESRHRILSKIGVVLEKPLLYQNMTVYENMKLQALVFDIDENRIWETLELLNLSAFPKQKASTLSLGMKQRLSLSIALLNNPELIILDEPTNGLDPNQIRELEQNLLDINKKCQTSFLIASHKLDEVERLMTKCFILSKGRICSEITKEDIEAQKMKGLGLSELFNNITKHDSTSTN